MKAIIFVPTLQNSPLDKFVYLYVDSDLLPHLNGSSELYSSGLGDPDPKTPGVYQCDVEPVPGMLVCCTLSNFTLLLAMPGQQWCGSCKHHKIMCAGLDGSIYRPVYQHYCQHKSFQSENCGDGRSIDDEGIRPNWCPVPGTPLPACPVCGDTSQNTKTYDDAGLAVCLNCESAFEPGLIGEWVLGGEVAR